MKRRVVSIVAWLVATVASILLATAAVGNVGGWGDDRPAPLQATASSLVTVAPTTSTTATEAPPATTVSPTTTVAMSTSSTTSTTATTQPDSSTTSTTQAPTTTQPPQTSTTSTSTTTTTAPPSGEFFASRQLIGGWVQLRVNGDNVYLEAAVPEPGFTVDVEHNGPEKVEVEFKSDSHDSKLTARVHDGELDINTEEEEEDDD